MIDLKLLADAIGLEPKIVCEIGVNAPDKCSVAGFSCAKILVEPLPWLAAELRRVFPNDLVFEGVIADRPGQLLLYDRGEGSFLISLPTSPDLANNNVQTLDPKFIRKVEAWTMERIDPGTIDVLAIDTEGAEWFALERMKSRPAILRVETHLAFHPYQNPYRAQIEEWAAAEGYRKLCETVSDTVFLKKP